MIRAAALITGAGSSTRMGSGKKKEYQFISGTPVFGTCLKSFIETGLFHYFTLTVPKGDTDRVRELIHPINVDVHIVEGGETRQQSVFNGLKALHPLSPDIVLIHDGARPWITTTLIEKVYSATIDHEACIPIVEIPDAAKEVDKNGFIVRHLKKHTLFGAQTPQGFSFPLIFSAHEKAVTVSDTFADDAEVLNLLGKKVFTVTGEITNRKITYAHDLEKA